MRQATKKRFRPLKGIYDCERHDNGFGSGLVGRVDKKLRVEKIIVFRKNKECDVFLSKEIWQGLIKVFFFANYAR